MTEEQPEAEVQLPGILKMPNGNYIHEELAQKGVDALMEERDRYRGALLRILQRADKGQEWVEEFAAKALRENDGQH